MEAYNLAAAELLIRLLAGILFFFQGYDKLFRLRISGVIEFFSNSTQTHHVPPSLIRLMAYFTSFAEFLGGLCLLAGLFTDYALYVLGADLIVVSIAFSYIEPMWDMRHVFPRLILLVLLLLLPDSAHQWCLDRWIGVK